MASTLSLLPFTNPSLPRRSNVHVVCSKACTPKPQPLFGNRRQLLFLLSGTTVLIGKDSPSIAKDIPLFGLRKKLKEAEDEAVEIVKEGFETAEKGLETAEKGVATVEMGIEAAEKEIEGTVSFPALAQAGAVAGAELVGVLVATSVVNGILGPIPKS